MDVTVFYNNDAGSSVSALDIRAAIERHEHRVVRLIEKAEGVEGLLAQPTDLVVAAGGDGTVATVARVVAGSNVPMTVLPLGTANNIAISLGCNGRIDAVISEWGRTSPVRTDIGVASGRWGRRIFIEGVGGGLVAETMSAIAARPIGDGASTEGRIQAALHHYLRQTACLEARSWSLRLDGELVTGRYLLVECLNIESIGPNFMLAAGADLSDGQFAVVLAGEADREQLTGYWRARQAGRMEPLDLERRYAAEITFERGGDLHIDDVVFEASEVYPVRLHMERGAIRVLRGPFAG